MGFWYFFYFYCQSARYIADCSKSKTNRIASYIRKDNDGLFAMYFANELFFMQFSTSGLQQKPI